jgi:thioredoxin 1
MLTVTDNNFDEVINQADLILVDFWAEWCGPCKKMLPVLEDISSEGKLLIGKLNVDENPTKSEAFAVTSIPTMILFKGGEPVHSIIGAKPKHVIMKEIEQWI